MTDKYSSFAELERAESSGTDYRISAVEWPESPVVVVAPHGGSIEVGTSELAALIAGDDHSLFAFEGLKAYGRNRDLHITSGLCDEWGLPGVLEGMNGRGLARRAVCRAKGLLGTGRKTGPSGPRENTSCVFTCLPTPSHASPRF